MAKTQRAPERTRLSRADMEATIKGGGSVLYNGEVISKLADLPTDVDLAIGDPDAESAQDSLIERQIEALKAEKTRLAQARAQRAQQRQAAAEAAPAAEGDEKGGGRRRKAKPGRKPGRKARAERGQEQTSEAAGGTEDAAGADDDGEGAE